MSLVLDCSATLAWVYADEASALAQSLFDRVLDAGAVVPGVWRLEVANALTIGMRRGRIDRDYRDTMLADLGKLDIKTDPDTDRQAWGRTCDVADRFHLTLYDAAYLELAIRRGLPLATLDQALARAAHEAGVAPLT